MFLTKTRLILLDVSRVDVCIDVFWICIFVQCRYARNSDECQSILLGIKSSHLLILLCPSKTWLGEQKYMVPYMGSSNLYI